MVQISILELQNSGTLEVLENFRTPELQNLSISEVLKL